MDDLVFLFDVDNTLVDNDRIQQDLREHLEESYGRAARERYWAIFDELWAELGYADYIGALERYRGEKLHDPTLLRMANWLLDYPFVERLYTGALDAVTHVRMGSARNPVRRRRGVPGAQGRALGPLEGIR